MVRAGQVGAHRTVRRVERSVEEQPLDPLVVVEVLGVAQVWHRRPDVSVQVGCAVSGDLQVVRCRQGRAAHELGDPAAPGHVELKAVDGTGLDQPRGVGQRPAVLTGRYIGPHLPPDRGQTRQIQRRDRLLEPGDADRGQLVSDTNRLADRIPAVRVHV